MRSPNSLGVSHRLSNSCPAPNTASTSSSPVRSWNCSAAATSPSTKPRPNPRYGTNTANPVNTPMGSASFSPTSARPTV